MAIPAAPIPDEQTIVARAAMIRSEWDHDTELQRLGFRLEMEPYRPRVVSLDGQTRCVLDAENRLFDEVR